MNVRPVEKRGAYKENRGADSILEIFDTESGERKTLARYKEVIEAPNWSKDGKALYFNREGRIVRYDLESGKEITIESGCADACNNDHVISADGKRIAVSNGTWEDGQSRIYVLPIEGGTPTLITPIAPSYLHGWSPDMKTLAYCAERDGQYDIYTISAEGGRETRLTNTPGLDDGPEYSPDGKHIWFNSTRTGLMQAWRMDADGSNQTQMTFDESNSWFPHVSPDGEKVVYITYAKGDVDADKHPPNKNVEIRLMSSKGGEFKTLMKFFGGQGTINVNSWSPCSKKFAFVSYELR